MSDGFKVVYNKRNRKKGTPKQVTNNGGPFKYQGQVQGKGKGEGHSLLLSFDTIKYVNFM